ncbi:MAG: Rpn family recombination-promoting nuclease/putative transposase [Thermoguttaceae bacterium]
MESTDVLKPTSDIFVASLFSAPKNEPMLRGVLDSVLVDSGWDTIRTTKVLNPFSIAEFAFDKRIVLDVRVEDERGRRYNVEVQTSPHKAFQERMLYGWAGSYSMQIHSGDDYTLLEPVFSVVITEFPIFAEADGVHLIFEACERRHPNVLFSRHFQIHILRLYELLRGRLGVLDGVNVSLRRWLNFFAFGGTLGEKEMSQIVDNDPLVMNAYAEFMRFSSDPATRDYLRRRTLAELDYRYEMRDAREEGIAEGEARGKAEERAATIVRILSHRLGTVPKLLEAKLHSLTDLETLENLLDRALDCPSIQDFERAVS